MWWIDFYMLLRNDLYGDGILLFIISPAIHSKSGAKPMHGPHRAFHSIRRRFETFVILWVLMKIQDCVADEVFAS